MTTVAQCADQSTMILMPKNRGLAAQARVALDERRAAPSHVTHVRGEDVGMLCNRAARARRKLLAITGDDLLDEWLADGNQLDSALVRTRRKWDDPRAIFGAPALCAIAGDRRVLALRSLRVAVCVRYARLSEPYLSKLEHEGRSLDRAYFQGSLESIVTAGLADMAIDIVVTGDSVRAADLEVLDIISLSHLAIVESR